MSLSFTSFAFDKALYNPGDVITLTVDYVSSDVAAATAVASAVTVALTDSSGTASQTSDGSVAFPDFNTSVTGTEPEPVSVSVTDSRSPSGTWTVVSNAFTGTTAPFPGVAVLTSVA